MNTNLLLRRILGVAAAALLIAAASAEPPERAEADPLPVDSQWKGVLTQRGKSADGSFFPPELEAAFTVTRRDGDDFEAELREHSESLDVTFLVRGKIERGPDMSFRIAFQSYGVKGVPSPGAYYVNVPYTARLSDDGLKGTWAYEEKENGLALEGDFKLKRSDD